MHSLSFCFALLMTNGLSDARLDTWRGDFHHQQVDERPKLEVCYTDSDREAFEVVAEDYHLVGALQKPHFLRELATGEVWLKLAVSAADGAIYATEFSDEPSRINLYRRGPYYCEVHWLDITVADQAGKQAPLKGDLALYCYPEKMLASITWHATADFEAQQTLVGGLDDRELQMTTLQKGESLCLAFPVFGETPASVIVETMEAATPLVYDEIRGCFVIGSANPGGFSSHFYQHPNFYETVRFRVKNNDQRTKLYVCHESVKHPGLVEGGMLLDEQGHPLPITVQISKNFAGEKEEPFYNPDDTPFSETFFPLILDANEEREVTSLHLYQNWGRHCVKQFSSLGAWMDYFHSSTGVTETTCFVPFKFGHLPGISIADFRAMSQHTFWAGQPQHDNVAGHAFLSYADDEKWNHLVYRGTDYFSTGPNWMDVGLNYLSSDGKIRATLRAFELPQRDQLRTFITVCYEVLKPLEIRNAPENFRLLSAGSKVQRLRYTHFASSGSAAKQLVFDRDHFGVRGLLLASENSYAALYGEEKGSNAFLLRRWSAPFSPAATVWCQKNGDTELMLVPGEDTIRLSKGDVIEFDLMLLPYGEVDGSTTCEREVQYYGTQAPRLARVIQGQPVSDFPTRVAAIDNKAEFIIQGGKELIPVIITGLTDYRKPSLWQKRRDGWRELRHNRVGELDGLQPFVDDQGRFGTVFLVASDNGEQHLRFVLKEENAQTPRHKCIPVPGTSKVEIRAAFLGRPLVVAFPERCSFGQDDVSLAHHWRTSEADSLWFQHETGGRYIGGRLTGNEQDVDVEFWVENRGEAIGEARVAFVPDLSGTVFDDPSRERTFALVGDKWLPAQGMPASDLSKAALIAVQSQDGRFVFGFAWPEQTHAATEDLGPIASVVTMPSIPPNRTGYIYGKIFLVDGNLTDLHRLFRREVAR